MPEKMTKEETVVAHTMNRLRVVKELLKEEKNLREAPETNERISYDSLGEEVKVKRPKKTGEKDTTKIENNTGTHSGYGLAGQESHFKKSDKMKEHSERFGMDVVKEVSTILTETASKHGYERRTGMDGGLYSELLETLEKIFLDEIIAKE